MDDEEVEQAFEEYRAQKGANEDALSALALARNWELEVDLLECDACGDNDIESGWNFGIGLVFADADGFCVMYDPDMDDPDTDNTLTWLCDEIEEAIVLIEMLLVRFGTPKNS